MGAVRLLDQLMVERFYVVANQAINWVHTAGFFRQDHQHLTGILNLA